MSRTKKDRPFWVVMNDKSLGIVEHHNHTPKDFETRLRTRKRGERVLEPYGDVQWILRYSDGTPGMTVEEDMEENHRWCLCLGNRHYAGSLRWYFEQPQRYVWKDREVVPIPSEGCNFRDDMHGENFMNSNRPCYVEPPAYKHPFRNYYNRPRDAEERKKNERSRRRASSQRMHALAVEYNSTGSVDEDWSETAPSHAPFGGAWWH